MKQATCSFIDTYKNCLFVQTYRAKKKTNGKQTLVNIMSTEKNLKKA